MGIKLFRSTYKIGNSRGLTLPIHWCRFYGTHIDRVLITGDKFLIVAPEGMADEACILADELERRTTLTRG
jgi:hypothetical protein